MNYESTIKKLKDLGDEKFISKYKNHGVKGDQFGVSFKDLKILRRKIKIDTQLALKLWNGKNYDARALATMIIDPKKTNINREYPSTLSLYTIGLGSN
jgi:3-methyladenine DNA glycosylase AlkD